MPNENDYLREILALTKALAAGGGGGATIPDTTNLIAGDGSGNGADSGIPSATVVLSNGTNAGNSLFSAYGSLAALFSGLYGVTPVADGTYTLSATLGGSITFQSGIVTAFTTAT